MREKNKIFITILLCILLMISGCSSIKGSKNTGTSTPQSTSGQQKTPNISKKTQLKVWSYNHEWDAAIEVFKSYNKGLDVQVEVFNPDDAPEVYLNALSEGTGPDVLLIDSKNFGQYVAADVLQDLSQAPFYADNYKNDFPESLWKVGLSLDGKRLLGLPLDTAPVVTFYRADILKKNGFPSDPEELGKFMESPQNWLEIAKRLKKNGQYIIEWPGDPPIEITGSSVGIYDHQLKYLRNTDVFKKVTDYAIEAHKQTLIANIEFLSDIGKRAVQSETLTMLYYAPSQIKTIESYVPGDKGKWRVTRLPFGTYGWAGSTIITMNSQCNQKDTAWKFIEFMATHQHGCALDNSIPAYIPSKEKNDKIDHSNPFLGGQNAYDFYLKLMKNTKEYPSTPLDSKSLEIFNLEIVNTVEQHLDTKNGLKNIGDKIEAQNKDEKNILLGIQ